MICGIVLLSRKTKQQEKLNSKTCNASRNTIPNSSLGTSAPTMSSAAELLSPADRHDDLHYKLWAHFFLHSL